MTEMPLSIPLDIKIKGLKALVAQVTNIQQGQLILATAVGELQQEMRELMTEANSNIEAIRAAQENTREGVSALLDAASASAVAQQNLQTALDAALADQGAAVQEAVNTAVAAEREANDSALTDLRTQAESLADFTPDAPAATPPAENPPTETPAEPAPPVDEPAPADPNAPVDGNVEPV